jgi:hypothetical protein
VERENGDLGFPLVQRTEDQGFARRQARVVDQEFRPEIVRAIDHEVRFLNEGSDIGSIEADGMGFQSDPGIRSREYLGGDLHLRSTHIDWRKEGLPGEIRLFDAIGIGEDEAADSGPGERGEDGTAQASHSDDEDCGAAEDSLSFAPPAGQPQLPVVV